MEVISPLPSGILSGLTMLRSLRMIGRITISPVTDYLVWPHSSDGSVSCKAGSLVEGRQFGLSGRPGNAPVIKSVVWSPPAPGWIKVNSDGAALGSLGVGGCGGVFRTCKSIVKACFAVPLGQVFDFEAELLTTSLAINYACNLGLHRIWLESDSSYVVQLLSIRSDQVT
ncbi:hypothetical protein Dsin_001201 [Dipteronia sinensis]|uniref:RNase H type-1 domain-containing protein n=1 Tax=Dipteronia sinensis TaxID=43782 RepID=A0AAE0B4S6_9ROSI|nr:hypothetical protein Dsin_001201 [Dipteronia sinensis]